MTHGSGSVGSWWLRAYSVNGYSDEASRLTCYADGSGKIGWTNAIHTHRVAFGISIFGRSGSAAAWWLLSNLNYWDFYNGGDQPRFHFSAGNGASGGGASGGSPRDFKSVAFGFC